ncbi:COG4315 family predicted lipoprotein [Streptomyces winkii]|uniref:hypothetical protein n=1 Tax=Streptomyces winkii TaxID=3051178 RepID=UPI0028D70EF6|nr:hypothetical protein [Streptomyces sp. DSM 40971]
MKTRSASPEVEGISGKVSTIKADGGGRQITVNGQPLYTFAADAKAGDVEARATRVSGTWSPRPERRSRLRTVPAAAVTEPPGHRLTGVAGRVSSADGSRRRTRRKAGEPPPGVTATRRRPR